MAKTDAKPSYYFPPLKTHVLTSKTNGHTYEIHVLVPVSKKDGSEKFPVLYMTDADGGIPISLMTRAMQTLGEMSRFIVVGIGYPVETVFNALYLRQRDMTPTKVERVRYNLPIEGIVEVPEGEDMGGAAQFLTFIRNELKPFINANYNTVAEDSGYFGHSLGGLFGLYVLFHQPDTFSRYVIGSPAMWWDDDITFTYAKAFLENHDALKAKVYLAAGGMEERWDPPKHYVSNLYRMDALLRSKPLAGFTLKTEVFPEEGHTSVFGMLHSRGLRAVYGPVKCSPFQPDCQ
jgi:predicted alpha/beta superfamily hydrolase